MALHQSRSLKESLNHVARLVWVHSSLIRCAGQNGELSAIVGFVHGTDRDPVRHVEVVVPPPDGSRMPARYV